MIYPTSFGLLRTIHLDGNHPVHAVAEGTLIAYRVTDSYLDRSKLKTYKSSKGDKTIVSQPLSDNFVLTEHRVTPPETKPFAFYVLYMNLLPLKELKAEQKKKASPLFCQNALNPTPRGRLSP